MWPDMERLFCFSNFCRLALHTRQNSLHNYGKYFTCWSWNNPKTTFWRGSSFKEKLLSKQQAVMLCSVYRILAKAGRQQREKREKPLVLFFAFLSMRKCPVLINLPTLQHTAAAIVYKLAIPFPTFLPQFNPGSCPHRMLIANCHTLWCDHESNPDWSISGWIQTWNLCKPAALQGNFFSTTIPVWCLSLPTGVFSSLFDLRRGVRGRENHLWRCDAE